MTEKKTVVIFELTDWHLPRKFDRLLHHLARYCEEMPEQPHRIFIFAKQYEALMRSSTRKKLLITTKSVQLTYRGIPLAPYHEDR